ncbi:MAG: DUF2254 family protein [Nitratireductor sp.]
MLIVSTFAVSAIVSAASAIANTATPRASRLILSDGRSQFVLSAFVAAFIYSIVSILALKALRYGEGGRFLLFMGLIGIVGVVLVSFIQWIDSVLKLGRQQTIIDKLAAFAINSAANTYSGSLGGTQWDGKLPKGAVAIFPGDFGYITAIEMKALQNLAEELDGKIILPVRTGDFGDPGYPIAWFCGDNKPDDDQARAIADKIKLYRSRNEDNDLRFNIINLSEVVIAALSSAINDPALPSLFLMSCARSCIAGRTIDGVPMKVRRSMTGSKKLLAASELADDAFAPPSPAMGQGLLKSVRACRTRSLRWRSLVMMSLQEALKISDEALDLALGALKLKSQQDHVRRLAKRVKDNAKKAS